MTVVIVGCGDLGTQAGLGFIAAGRNVLGLRRSPAVLPASFATQAIDLSTDVPVLPSDTEIVVLVTSASGRSEEAYRASYQRPAENVLTAIRRDCPQPPRILFVSSTSVWDVDDGSRVDESTPAIPSSPTSAVLLETEQLLRNALPGVTALRLAGIYGPGRGRMIEQAREGRSLPTGRPHLTNRIHRDDAAAAIVHLTSMAARPEPVYLGVDDEPVDREDVLQFIAAELGIARLPAAAESLEQPTGKRCVNTRLRSTGFLFTHPSYREGYRAILAGVGVRNP